jgi:hypothetical protein
MPIFLREFWIKRVNKIIGEKQEQADAIRAQQEQAATRAKSRR